MSKDAKDAGTENSRLTESMGSSPLKDVRSHAADEKAAVGTKFQLRSEKPTEPPTLEPAFAQLDVPNTSVGNADYTAEMKDEGKLGLFLSRERARLKPTMITLNVERYFIGIQNTIRDSMKHLLRKKTELNNNDALERIDDISYQLATGACLMTYMKLRALIFIELRSKYSLAYLKRPKVITDLPVVAPFAFAIQQLGAVNIANLAKEARFIPVFPETGHVYGIPPPYKWSPNQYAEAVDYARTLGLHFNVIDLKQKEGTAWWLLKQQFSEDIFELKLPFPEVNYTSAMALTHSLFLYGAEDDPSNAIFDLTPCGNGDFGYLLRDPHVNINVSTYETLDESAKEIVENV